MCFAESLTKIMRDKRISASELARQVGITRASITYYTQGKAFPREATLQKIAVVLGCDVDELEEKDMSVNIAGMKKVPVGVAAKMLGVNPQCLRVGLKKKQVPFGFGVENPGGRWSFVITPAALLNFIAADTKQKERVAI